MLQETTITLLEEACNKSNQVYEQGGLSYQYVFGNCFPLTLKNRDRKEKLSLEKNTCFYPDEVDEISEFFEIAMFSSGSEHVSETTQEFVSRLLSSFDIDFTGLPRGILEHEKEFSSILKLLFLDNGNYHGINLVWSPS